MNEVYYMKKDAKTKIGTEISMKLTELFGVPNLTTLETLRLSWLDDGMVNVRITVEGNFTREGFDKLMAMLPEKSEDG